MPPLCTAAACAAIAFRLCRHRFTLHRLTPHALPSLMPPPPQITAVARLGCALPPPPPPPSQSSARAASNPRRDPPRVAARIAEVRAESPATRCRQQSPGFAPPQLPLRPGHVVVVVLEDVVDLALCSLAGVSGRPKKWPTKVGGGALGFKGGTENQGAVCYPATIRCAAAAALALRAWPALSLDPSKRSGPAMVADRMRTAGGSSVASSASFLPRIMPGCQ